MVEVIERGLEVSKRQAVFLAKEVENQEGRLPRTYEGGDRKHLITGHGFPAFSRECYGICMKNTPTDELEKDNANYIQTGGSLPRI